MYVLGTMFIVSGSAAALFASLSYVLVMRGNAAALTYGRMGVRVTLGAALLTVMLLVYVFLTRRYDITYVYSYSSNERDLRYRVVALWASPARLLSGRSGACSSLKSLSSARAVPSPTRSAYSC